MYGAEKHRSSPAWRAVLWRVRDIPKEFSVGHTGEFLVGHTGCFEAVIHLEILSLIGDVVAGYVTLRLNVKKIFRKFKVQQNV